MQSTLTCVVLTIMFSAIHGKTLFDEKEVNDAHCTTKQNTTGVCVDVDLCPEKQKLFPHGFVDDADERTVKCMGAKKWCCENPVQPTTRRDTVEKPIYCETKQNTNGTCVDVGLCPEKQKLFPNGYVEVNEERTSRTDCVGANKWCCENPLQPTTASPVTITEKPTSSDESCSLAPDSHDTCPWCVAIYRTGGNPYHMTKSGRFCGGVLIGKRVVLTAATCIPPQKKIWVKAPSSPTPDRTYAVQDSIYHRIKMPGYNTGSGEKDFALMILDEDLFWDNGTQKMAACLGLGTQLIGNCFVIGLNADDQIIMTAVTVRNGSCTIQGDTYDAACGTANGVCRAAFGSPVLCPSDMGGFIVAGVIRGGCTNNTVLLGGLKHHKDWFEDILKTNGLDEPDYKIV